MIWGLCGPSGAFSLISWLFNIQSRHDAYQIIFGVAEINQETKVWLVNPGPHPIEVSEGQVPIPKGKKSVDKSQWRPTTLLPMPSKIVERIVHSQFMRFLIDNEILSECQFVFCKNR